MAIGQDLQGLISQFQSNDDVSLKHKTEGIDTSEDSSSCFDCNICLDSAHDPVVTLCGHLYCWPCIYKWIQVQKNSSEAEAAVVPHQNCPVCKATISLSSLVPLYGPGSSNPSSKSKRPNLDIVIPHRPHASGVYPIMNQQVHHHQYVSHPFEGYMASRSANPGATMNASVMHPTVGMFGEMVYARIFGSTNTSLFAYYHPYSNSSPIMGNTSPRVRRQAIQAEESLRRVTIFLFCCFVLCLLLF